jgi:hypothetical protein
MLVHVASLPDPDLFVAFALDEAKVGGHSCDFPVELMLVTFESMREEDGLPEARDGSALVPMIMSQVMEMANAATWSQLFEQQLGAGTALVVATLSHYGIISIDHNPLIPPEVIPVRPSRRTHRHPLLRD